ncbi:DUF6924 domain-containing protein [Micromonospora sp. NPDC000668]|uniref:DUF6924 domain-containing protein n=1 Tax=Micromonospora sp. NPDC000668 TaxID=3364219 RepID=UPI0036AF4EB8
MAHLPETWCVPVVRADFRDDGIWERLKDEIVSPTEEGFVAGVEFVEDRTLIDLSDTAIEAGYPRAYPHQYRHPVVFVVDAVTVSLPEHPLFEASEPADASPLLDVPICR